MSTFIEIGALFMRAFFRGDAVLAGACLLSLLLITLRRA